ncbi:MAG: hypothetical protein WC799_00700 [Desulfobacteraceae bacterium]|jgi:simple sugar transport system permease protein
MIITKKLFRFLSRLPGSSLILIFSLVLCSVSLILFITGVNEIFAGLGLNFVGQGLALWLIFGPWKRPGIASMSGTDPIGDSYFLLEKGLISVSPFALFMVLLSFICTYFLIRMSLVGLKLHASGSNPFATRLLGLRPTLSIFFALAMCGGLAGLAGFFQVTGVYHRLSPSISSNYGYLFR